MHSEKLQAHEQHIIKQLPQCQLFCLSQNIEPQNTQWKVHLSISMATGRWVICVTYTYVFNEVCVFWRLLHATICVCTHFDTTKQLMTKVSNCSNAWQPCHPLCGKSTSKPLPSKINPLQKIKSHHTPGYTVLTAYLHHLDMRILHTISWCSINRHHNW